MIEILLIFFTSIVTENAVFTHLYGVSPFMKITGKLQYTLVFGLFITVTGVLSTACFKLVSVLFLEKLGAEYLSFFCFALISAIITQVLANALKTANKKLYSDMRDMMVFAALNTVVIGTALALTSEAGGIAELLLYDIAYSLGFILASFAFCSVMQRVSVSDPPKAFKGTPAAFIAAGLIIMAFYGLTGMKFGDAVTTAFLRFKM